MSGPSEAWGLKVGETIEFVRGPVTAQATWRPGKVLRFDFDKTIWVKDEATAKSIRIHNPKAVRKWKAPQTLEEIERFLQEGP